MSTIEILSYDNLPPTTPEAVLRMDVRELDARFYDAVELVGAITVEGVERQMAEEANAEFWLIVRGLPNPSFQEIASEIDDLRIARQGFNRLRNGT